MITRQATGIGSKAKCLVTAPGFSGQVLAVLSDVAYLSGGEGEILWLNQEEVPFHRRGIQLSFPMACLCSGQPFLLEGARLKIGSALAIDLGRAAEWTPVLPGPGEPGLLFRVTDSVRQLLGTLSSTIRDESPGRVILRLSSIHHGSTEAPFSPLSWQALSLSPIFGLMKHCLEGGLTEIEIRGREVIGLGPGLTPSGDDFLGGILFAAHWLHNAFSGKRGAERSSICNLIQWGRNRTSPISYAFLGDLAVGQGPEPLHNLLLLLLKGEDPDGRMMEAVNGLLKIGHTTGWFILAGLLTCLLSVNEFDLKEEKNIHGRNQTEDRKGQCGNGKAHERGRSRFGGHRPGWRSDPRSERPDGPSLRPANRVAADERGATGLDAGGRHL